MREVRIHAVEAASGPGVAAEVAALREEAPDGAVVRARVISARGGAAPRVGPPHASHARAGAEVERWEPPRERPVPARPPTA